MPGWDVLQGTSLPRQPVSRSLQDDGDGGRASMGRRQILQVVWRVGDKRTGFLPLFPGLSYSLGGNPLAPTMSVESSSEAPVAPSS